MKDTIKVVEVLDQFTAVLNYGFENGAEVGQKFLIYSLSENEIIDPDTKESLGKLEIVKGTGQITNVQNKLSTISSDRFKQLPPTITHTRNRFYQNTQETVEQKEPIPQPFDSIQTGDFAKRIG